MRMSASRIRSINRSIARVHGIVCGASDRPRRVPAEDPKRLAQSVLGRTVRIIAVPRPSCA
jgi:hypothetical protein